MARVGKSRLYVSSEDKEERIELEFVVNVSTEGVFTATLSEDDVLKMESLGATFGTNGRSNGRKGFFSNKTHEGLLVDIKNIAEHCVSRKLINEEIILRYQIATSASFARTIPDENGVSKIVPGPGYGHEGKIDGHWRSGTISSHASSPKPVMSSFFVKPYKKFTYRYSSGSERVEYRSMSHYTGSDHDNSPSLSYLCAICSMSPYSGGGEIKEMPYDEIKASWFVDMHRSVCMLAELMTKFAKADSEDIVKFIESGVKLLG